MDKILIIFLVLFTLLLYSATVNIQDAWDEPLIQDNVNVSF